MKRLIAFALLSACAPDHDAPRHIVAVPETTTTSSAVSTTVVAPEPSVRNSRATRTRRAPAGTAGRVASSDLLDALARCESGMRPDAHSRSGRYHGAFQFALSTWRGLGYEGDPHEQSYEVQKAAAARLLARSGWGQFPGCAGKLGVR